MATIGRSATPTNVSEGFYSVPFLQSLEALLNNASVFNQVYNVTYMLQVKRALVGQIFPP